jgi:hypothetical protein
LLLNEVTIITRNNRSYFVEKTKCEFYQTGVKSVKFHKPAQSINQYPEEEITLWMVHLPSTKIARTSFPLAAPT